jgi:hypothetical protein
VNEGETAIFSNSAGTVSSAIVSMAITAANASNTGTFVSATQGGVVTAGTGAEGEPSLVIPAGALSGNTTMTLVASSSSAIGLPAGAVALGDVLEIGPSGLTFNSPVTLYLPVPANIPADKVLAVIELPGTSAGQAKASINTAQSAFRDTNLGRLAKSRALTGGVMAMAAGVPVSVLCANTQDIRGGSLVFDFNKVGASYLVAAVSPETCTSPIVPQRPRVKLPSSSTTPCSNEDWAPISTGGSVLISRHVQCVVRVYNIDINGADGTEYGSFRWETRVGSYGQPNGLNKTFSFSSRVMRTAAASLQSEKRSDALPPITYQPEFKCISRADDNAQCKLNPITVSLKALARIPSDPNIGWSNPVNTEVSVSWAEGDGSWREFDFGNMILYYAGPGQSIDLTTRYWIESSGLEPLRCDKKVADGTSLGCVYPRAPAILVLAANDGRIAEAAAHIREAQAAGSPGGLYIENGVAFTSVFTSPLQRTRVTALKGRDTPPAEGANRNYSCKYAESVIRLRPKSSSTCPIDGAGCDCDEYPFNSTWNGGYLNRDATSAKYINSKQNRAAGSTALFRFYANERVIDLTPDPGITFTQDLTPEELSRAIPARTGGDDYWVHVE